MNCLSQKTVAVFVLTLLCFIVWACACPFGQSDQEKCVDRFLQALQDGERSALLAEIDPDSFLYTLMQFSLEPLTNEGIQLDYETELVEENEEDSVVRVTGTSTHGSETQDMDVRFVLVHDGREDRWLIETIEGWEF